MSDYKLALKEAGAEILAFESFGSYQGEWWAKVIWNGETGWVNGSYGSCSGCDAYQSEFGFINEECEAHRYDYQETCPDCVEVKAAIQQRIINFGKTYLEDMLLTQEEAEKKASANIEWDTDAVPMLEWIKSQAATKKD